MARVFLSYRREDSVGYGGRIYDRLSEHFGEENVFRDIDTLKAKLGVDFAKEIERAVISCSALVAIIGKHWITPIGEQGQLRLNDPEDFVRLEIETALNQNIRVIPTLVGGAAMPSREDLPESLAELGRKQALEITERHFHTDIDLLIDSIEGHHGRPGKSEPWRGETHFRTPRQIANDTLSLLGMIGWIFKGIKLYVFLIVLLLVLIIIVFFGGLALDGLHDYFSKYMW